MRVHAALDIARDLGSPFVCVVCGEGWAQRWTACPACGQLRAVHPRETKGAPSAAPDAPTPLAIERSSSSMNLEDVASFDDGPALRVPRACAPWSQAFCGKLPCAARVLVYGRRGLGKSTEVLRLLGAVATPQRRALWLSSEQDETMVRALADRAGVPLNRFRFERVRTLADAVRALSDEPAAIALDSLSHLADLDGTSSKHVAIELHRVAPAGVPLVLIGHVTGAGKLRGGVVPAYVVDVEVRIFRGSFKLEKSRLREYRSPVARPKSARGNVVAPTR